MAEKLLMKGNEAIAESALRAGMDGYFGYPITPQNEITAYMSARAPELERAFVQAESEIAAISMIYGAAATGKRCMTTSSSPGIALMQEGISYMCGAEVPGVIVNITRGGPGLGNIGPSQCDYNQATRGGGNGDYNMIVYAPHTVQEAVDLTYKSFEISEKYRNPVMILGDGALGQMAEAVVLPDFHSNDNSDKGWELTGAKGRSPRSIKSLRLAEGGLLDHNNKLQEKLEEVQSNEVRYSYKENQYDVLIVAFGTAARVAKTTIRKMQDAGLNVGLFRPVSLLPFPYRELSEASAKAKNVLVVEMNRGQMLVDVRLSVQNDEKISFIGKPGGETFMPEEIEDKIRKVLK